MAFDSGLLIEGGSLGSKNGSTTKVAQANLKKNKVEVYPNPFSNGVNVKLSDELSTKEIEATLSDIVGRQLYLYSGKGSQLNEHLKTRTSQLGTGIYTLTLRSGDHRQVMKLQKQYYHQHPLYTSRLVREIFL